MDDAVKPVNSHIALNVITDADGNELKIVRHNMPFGQIGKGEFGTYFIGYSRDPAVTERMLDNMFVGDPPGNTDRILRLLDRPDRRACSSPRRQTSSMTPRRSGRQPAQRDLQPGSDGSLGIGSLKGTPR